MPSDLAYVLHVVRFLQAEVGSQSEDGVITRQVLGLAVFGFQQGGTGNLRRQSPKHVQVGGNGCHRLVDKARSIGQLLICFWVYCALGGEVCSVAEEAAESWARTKSEYLADPAVIQYARQHCGHVCISGQVADHPAWPDAVGSTDNQVHISYEWPDQVGVAYDVKLEGSAVVVRPFLVQVLTHGIHLVSADCAGAKYVADLVMP